jgi:hypothetical protein
MAPTASELLAAWERGLSAPPGRRALELAALAEDDPGALTVGERDAALLALREELFGPAIEGIVDCESCGEALELSTTTATLRGGEPAAPGLLQVGGYEIELDPPSALDLAEAAGEVDEGAALERLLAGAVRATRDGLPVAPSELPAEVVATVDAALAAADPLADLELTATCPACGEASTTRFDIASFFWAELDRYALRTLREIHTLASAYGWTEDEILALGRRRRLYLELVEA